MVGEKKKKKVKKTTKTTSSKTSAYKRGKVALKNLRRYGP